MNAERFKLGVALRLAVIAEDDETAARQIGSHGAAHVTEPDEANASGSRAA